MTTKWLWLACFVSALAACGKDKRRDGMSLDVPAVEPIVRSATPAGLVSDAALQLDAGETLNPAQALKRRLYSAGPTQILKILANVDEAMAGYQSRVDGKVAPCLADYEGSDLVAKEPMTYPEFVDFDGDGSNILDLHLPAYLNCAESVDASATWWRAFGKTTEADKTYWSIHEGAGPAGGSTIRVAEDGSEAELWFRVGQPGESGSKVLAHLSRHADGVIEYTHSGNGVGYDCGLHLLSKNNLMFIVVASEQEVLNADTPCDSAAVGHDTPYCIDGSTTSFAAEDLTVCAEAGLTSAAFTMTSMSFEIADEDQVTRAFSESRPQGIADFTTEDPPKKE